MVERPLDKMTLREMISQTLGLIRDTADHFEMNFNPKLQSLDHMVHSTGVEAETVTDLSVRNKTAELLQSDQFTRDFIRRIQEHLRAIDKSLASKIS